ncbi:hypothetical protein KSF_065070 [Reticulibacter mediterranei]|uniref:Uncharacterized protein n=1 Tax=Reticulibacter mediterranei TaxID=2778369 RepID=A0A8J3N2V2_9CHLR|nr:hypothetical protein KSF_065070 [Reticulibacter mediterranei]
METASDTPELESELSLDDVLVNRYMQRSGIEERIKHFMLIDVVISC